jgi:diguanylate cyclase (GGDEF)-like protein/PAS domain S-box-containing protein
MTFDITAQKAIEKKLADSEKRLRMVADSLPALIARIDNDERYTFTNEHYRNVYGADPASFIGKTLRDVLGDGLHENATEAIAAVKRGEAVHFESERHSRGAPEYFQIDFIPDRDATGPVEGFYVMVLDITARKRAELQQAESALQLRTIADNLPVLISFVDADGVVQFCNATYESWFGKTRDRLVGQPLHEALGDANFEAQATHFRRALARERVEFDLDVIGPEATRQARSIYVPRREEDGRIAGFHALTMDMTAIKRVERELHQLARFDSLTSLANRRQLDEDIPRALARARRSGAALVLMFLDIDRFKSINDSIGHGGGDEVLQEFAQRLIACVRSTDVVVRLAGDEFVILVENVPGAEDGHVIARKILAAMAEPFKLTSGDRSVSASIGIALAPDGAVSPAQIMLRADEALYEAKAAGRNAFRVVVCAPRAADVETPAVAA